MATTRIMPLHTGKGRSVGTAIRNILEYVEDPAKTGQGRLITASGCNVPIADAEFLFSKQQYLARTGRRRGADDVIAYHVRQAFVPGGSRRRRPTASAWSLPDASPRIVTHLSSAPT